MRLIDVDALIETLSDKLPKWGFKTIDMHVVKTLIKNEPTISQWVPVSEKLPEDNTEVLAQDGDGFYYLAWYEYDNYSWWDNNGLKYEDVIAWMSLPQPYKESDK